MDIRLTPKQTIAFETTANEIFFGGALGGGKAASNDTDVCTPFGFRKMGDLKVGDTVTSSEGTPTKIIAVYPQGIRQTYKITFQDGASCEVDGDHLWNYSISGKGKWRKSGLAWKVATTKQLIEMRENGREILIPMTKPVNFTKSYRYDYRKIAPYTLGVLLGDGHISNEQVNFSNPDNQIHDRVYQLTPGEWRHDGNLTSHTKGQLLKDLKEHLTNLKLYGKLSNEKFIPYQYKFSSAEDRLNLLQGLMDTDGTVNEGKAYYTTVSEQLAKDVKFLVSSLGGRATITSKLPINTTTGKEGQLAYTLYIRMPHNADIFYLDRKKEAATEYMHDELKRRIVSIEPCRETECTCIAIDHPSKLFLITEDFIVTHNSYINKIMAISVCMSVPNAQVAILRNTSKNIRKNYFSGSGSMPQLLNEYIKAKEVKIDYSNLVINFNNGAAIHAMHCEHTETAIENLQGLEFALIIFDEAALISPEVIKHSKTRLRLGGLKIEDPFWAARLPRLMLSSNPGGVGHGYLKENYINPAPPMTKFKNEAGLTSIFIPSNFRDNPAIDHDSYEKQVRATGDPVKIAQLIDGDWDAGAASIFEHSFRRHINVLPTFRIPDSWPVRRAYDDGWSSPFSVNWIATVTDENDVEIDFGGGRKKTLSFPYGTRIVVDEWYGWNGQDRAIGLKMDPKEIAKGILKREEQSYYGDRVKPGAADNAIWNTDRPVADDMRSVGVSFVRSDKSKGSRVRGWKLISEMMKNAHEEVVEKPALYFMEHCIHVIEDISSAPVSKKDPDDIDTDSLDHTLDSLRYEIANKGNSLKMVNCIGL